jgi:release factor glutamine methyltransferase
MAEVWTIKRLLEWTTQFLSKKGIEKAWLDADLLLAHALGWKRTELRMRYDEEAPEAGRERFRELVRRRAEGCPVAYLIRRKEFFLLDFEVSPAVLIPRDDTEWLLTEFFRLAKGMPSPRVLDVGTGSGCLAVAVAQRMKEATVTAIDLSPEALAVAGRNAVSHGVADRITFLEGDLFAPLPAGAAFDFILSNPPYIRREELAGLQREVRDFEPRLALDGGEDGFAVFSRLVEDARGFLAPGGTLLVEIGWTQEEEARRKLEHYHEYAVGKTVQDGGGHPRVMNVRRVQ